MKKRSVVPRIVSLLASASTIGAVMLLAAPADASSAATGPAIAKAAVHHTAPKVVIVTCTNDVLDPVVATLKGIHYVEYHAYTKCAPKNGSHLVKIFIGHRLLEWEQHGGSGGKPGWVTVGENGCNHPGVANSRLHCAGDKKCTPLKHGNISYIHEMYTAVDVEWKGNDYIYRFPDGWQQGDETNLTCRV